MLFDYDNDGYPDVFIANGNAHHEYPEDAVLARNDGKRRLRGRGARSPATSSRRSGSAAAPPGPTSTTTATSTSLVVDTSGPPHLLRNDGGTGNHWLKVDARVKGGDADGHRRARDRARPAGARQIQDVIGVNGYLSQGDTRAHFGLGAADKADLVQVRWPDGTTDEWKDVKADQVLRVEQGKK